LRSIKLYFIACFSVNFNRVEAFISVYDNYWITIAFSFFGPIHTRSKIVKKSWVEIGEILCTYVIRLPCVIGIGIGQAVTAYTKFKITAPTNLRWHIRIGQTIGHNMHEGWSITFNAPFVFRVQRTEITMVLNMLSM